MTHQSRTAGDNLSRQNGHQETQRRRSGAEKVQDKLFLENAAMVAADSEAMSAALGLWIMHGRPPEWPTMPSSS
jgi:hypothetical protein